MTFMSTVFFFYLSPMFLSEPTNKFSHRAHGEHKEKGR